MTPLKIRVTLLTLLKVHVTLSKVHVTLLKAHVTLLKVHVTPATSVTFVTFSTCSGILVSPEVPLCLEYLERGAC